ncbi:MAG: hypothetical protein FWE34_07480 [Defluviitaleaceae bacterium]|nr:hypothetical protein [Defluviitaleaceae bacterium]
MKNMTLRAKFVLSFSFIILIFVAFALFTVFVSQVSILIVATIIAIILILIVLSILMRIVVIPAITISKSSKDFVSGNLKNIIAYKGNDELGQISDYLTHSADSLFRLREAKHLIESKMRRHEFGERMPTDAFDGEFKVAATLTNSIISCLEDELDNLSLYLEKFAVGEFTYSKGYGQKSRHIVAVSALSRTISEISADIQSIVSAAASGDFKKRIICKKYSGEWNKLAQNLNKLMDALIVPIEQTKVALDAIAIGKMDVKVDANAKGELLKLKVSANNASTALTKYLGIIAQSLENIERKSRHLSELPNDFVSIKVALANLNIEGTAKSRRDIAFGGKAGSATTPLQEGTNISTPRKKINPSAVNKVSGAPRIDGLQVNTGETPVYMQSDFGKY